MSQLLLYNWSLVYLGTGHYLLQVAAILRAQSPGSTCQRGLNVTVESDDEAQEANEVVEWDDEAQDEADEAVKSNLV